MILETPLMIEAGDVQIDAIGHYDENGALITVFINDCNLAVAQVSAALFILCPDDVGPWADDLDGDTLNVLMNEAAENAACERAEHQRELAMEATL